MSNLIPNPLLETISHLRQEENIILYTWLNESNSTQDKEIILFLENEYDNEQLDYPFNPPKFNEKAGLWSAKIIYYTAQFILYRKDSKSSISRFIQPYDDELTPSAILSGDLCLRFLPFLIDELKNIDPEDTLIGDLKSILMRWHYAAIGTDIDTSNINIQPYMNHPTVKQLYLDRVVSRKAIAFADHPTLNSEIIAHLGIYKSQYWNELRTIKK